MNQEETEEIIQVAFESVVRMEARDPERIKPSGDYLGASSLDDLNTALFRAGEHSRRQEERAWRAAFGRAQRERHNEEGLRSHLRGAAGLGQEAEADAAVIAALFPDSGSSQRRRRAQEQLGRIGGFHRDMDQQAQGLLAAAQQRFVELAISVEMMKISQSSI